MTDLNFSNIQKKYMKSGPLCKNNILYDSDELDDHGDNDHDNDDDNADNTG